jgi:predicted membrane protein
MRKIKRFLTILDEAIWRYIVKPVSIGIFYALMILFCLWTFASVMSLLVVAVMVVGSEHHLPSLVVWNAYVFIGIFLVMLIANGIFYFTLGMKQISKEMKDEEKKNKNVMSLKDLQIDLQEMQGSLNSRTPTRAIETDG